MIEFGEREGFFFEDLLCEVFSAGLTELGCRSVSAGGGKTWGCCA